jgi:hypothetical protein
MTHLAPDVLTHACVCSGAFREAVCGLCLGWAGDAGKKGPLGCGHELRGILREETRISWKAGRATLSQETACSAPAPRSTVLLQDH